jgi:uncharacterized membrane protein YphA (DoxX/SURF4 family)
MKKSHVIHFFPTFFFALSLGLIFCFVMPSQVSAHEVYVLTPAQITQAIGTPPFDMVAVALDNLHLFVFWGFITALVIFCVFFISILRFLERWLDPFFVRIRPYAPLVGRITIGLSFLAAAYYQATYGPELPIAATYGSLTGFITVVLVVIGTMTILGLYVRIAAIIALIMYVIAICYRGWYMLTYINYMGEIIALIVLGSHNWSIDSLLSRNKKNTGAAAVMTTPPPSPHLFSGFFASVHSLWHRFALWLAPKSFAILRVCFGISLIFASAYAKIIYNNLGLFTVEKYHLDKILGFEPHFLVLGAAIIEVLIGLFIILGIEIRFAALFFEFWLMQSLFFFGEVVWPHIILIGIPIALIMYGYDQYSVEGYFFRKKKYEPVL